MDADLDRLRGLDGIKWRKYGPEVVPAWVADMDFDVAGPIKAAIVAMAERGDFGYSSVASDALLPAWMGWQDRHHGWQPPADECRVFTGVLHGLETVLDDHTGPGDGVVLFSPIYPPFRTAIEALGREVVDVPLRGPDWRLPVERFADAITDTTRVVLFCQPHNPLGRVFDAEELAAFAEVCERHDLLVISDEIWADITHEIPHLPLVQADDRLAARTVTLCSLSKTFGVPGLRLGVAHVGPAAVRRALDARAAHEIGAPSTLSMAAAVAAWTACDDWYAAVRRQLGENRDHVVTRVHADLPGVHTHTPEATYLSWLDFSQTALADDPAELLLGHGVALNRGETFGPQARSWARLNFATSPAILDAIVDRIAAALDG